MSGTTDFVIWAVEKYGEDDDGQPLVGFERAWEFFADDLDDTLQGRNMVDWNYDLFLSYSWADQTEVRKLAALLVDHGLTVWLDADVVRQGKDSFYVWRVIRAGLKVSRDGLAFITPSFLEKKWPLHESRGMTRHGMLAFALLSGVTEAEALEALGTDGHDLDVFDCASHELADLAARVSSNWSARRT